MIIVFRKSDRRMMYNTGYNSNPGIPKPARSELLQRAVDLFGGVRGRYDTFELDDVNDTATVQDVLRFPTTFVEVTPDGKPIGVTHLRGMDLSFVWHYYGDMSSDDDPPIDCCTYFPRKFDTLGCVEIFASLPNQGVDNEIEFIIEPEETQNRVFAIPIIQGNRIEFGDGALCGSTRRPTARLALQFTRSGEYTLLVRSKNHGTQTHVFRVRRAYQQGGDERGPVDKKPWRMRYDHPIQWEQHPNGPGPKFVQNVIMAKRREMTDTEELIVKMDEMQRMIEAQNAILESYEEMRTAARVLYRDFYGGQTPPF